MKLEYKILWFDDQPQNVQGAEASLRNKLFRLGFKLEIEWIRVVKDINSFAAELRNKNDYDLILMDWDLGKNSPNGAILSKKIRNNSDKEIVFYSSASPKELRTAIFDQDIDGVYCTKREHLAVKAISVISNTIKKIIDVNHMRGIIMAAVSDFDHIIDECINVRFSQLNEEGKLNLLKNIREKIINVCNSNLRQIDAIKDEIDINILTSHRAFSSALKHAILKELLKDKRDEPDLKELIACHGKYIDEIIQPRNTFAHSKTTVKGNSIVFDGSEEEHGEEQFKKIRQNLLEHHETLILIKAAITEGMLD